MRRRRVVIVLLLAILSGAVAGLAALRFLQERPAPLTAAESRSAPQPVIVAARSLPLGAVLGEQDVRVVDWPGDAVPPGYARSVPEVVGRGLVTPVEANEPILDMKLADRTAGGGLPVIIPEGMRALSVRVDEVVGVAGFVIPGTRVDVLLTVPDPGQNEPATQVILQNVQAIAAGQSIQRDVEGKPVTVTVITVLVSPEDAEILTLAANQGRIQMALRNMMDLDTVTTRGIRVSGLLPGVSGTNRRTGATAQRPASQPARVQPARPGTVVESTRSVIEVYRGGVRTLITY